MINIKTPCGERWNEMQTAPDGRFCLACQKTVVDFTGMSDAEMVEFFKKAAGQRICGRLRSDQIKRPLAQPAAPPLAPQRSMRASAALALSLGLWLSVGNPALQAKPLLSTPTGIEQTVFGNKNNPPKNIVRRSLKGIVRDQNGMPVFGAKVVIIQKDGKEFSTYTDENGRYSFKKVRIGIGASIQVSHQFETGEAYIEAVFEYAPSRHGLNVYLPATNPIHYMGDIEFVEPEPEDKNR